MYLFGMAARVCDELRQSISPPFFLQSTQYLTHLISGMYSVLCTVCLFPLEHMLSEKGEFLPWLISWYVIWHSDRLTLLNF